MMIKFFYFAFHTIFQVFKNESSGFLFKVVNHNYQWRQICWYRFDYESPI